MSEAAPPPDQGLPPSFAHEAPTGWVTGIFNKAKNGHAKQFELAQEECEKRARASGWRPRERSEWAGWSDADPSCYIHNALQQLGVGVGHELYGELMAEVDARDIMVREKKQTVERLGLTKILGRHMINVASLNDLLAVFFLVSSLTVYSASFGVLLISCAARTAYASNPTRVGARQP